MHRGICKEKQGERDGNCHWNACSGSELVNDSQSPARVQLRDSSASRTQRSCVLV